MTDALVDELIAAREARKPFTIVTVAATTGSVPRAAGSKMFVYVDGKTSGTIGGGKFESLVIADAQASMREKKPLLKTYPLREGSTDSFGAICGGDVTVFIEPQAVREALYLVGAGHCAQAIAKLANECGLYVSVIDDRVELLADLPAAVARVSDLSPVEFIASHQWQSDEALVLVSRNHEIDRHALAAAVEQTGAGYIGMIGSKRKVRHVFDHLRQSGVSEEKLSRVFAPLGLDIGADSPAEIAVSTIAEILAVLRQRDATHLRMSANGRRLNKKGTDMAEEKKWEKWEGPGTPEGTGGTSTPESTAANEVQGRGRQLVAVCFKCGTQSYVGVDWKWFTCWKCGGMSSSEMMA